MDPLGYIIWVQGSYAATVGFVVWGFSVCKSDPAIWSRDMRAAPWNRREKARSKYGNHTLRPGMWRSLLRAVGPFRMCGSACPGCEGAGFTVNRRVWYPLLQSLIPTAVSWNQ